MTRGSVRFTQRAPTAQYDSASLLQPDPEQAPVIIRTDAPAMGRLRYGLPHANNNTESHAGIKPEWKR